MRLAVVILNFRASEEVQDCLTSLFGQIDPSQDRVIVVDNGSGDGSVGAIERLIGERGWGDWAEVMPLPENLGFAAGNNRALAAVDADAYLLLNSDTIVLQGAVEALCEAMTAHPEAGIISAALERSDGTAQTSAFRAPRPLSELVSAAASGPVTRLLPGYEVPLPVSSQPQFPDWVCFASVLIRREVVQRIGLLDEGYFLYFEDVDYCLRARAAGWRILVWPVARVVHLHGWPDSPSEKREGSAFWHASRARYYGKFFGRHGLWWANVCWMVGRLASFTRQQLGHRGGDSGAGRAARIWTNWRDPLQAGVRSDGIRSPSSEMQSVGRRHRVGSADTP